MEKPSKDRSAKADEILDVAEKMARTGGYHGFSFREIAKQVGIKAASVHYHFPSKDELGAAVAQRYTKKFLSALGDPSDPNAGPMELLQRYVDLYRQALVEEELMCLCGVFGAEVGTLPDPVATEIAIFFEENIAWLTKVLRRFDQISRPPEPRRTATRILSTLEGAMILARTMGNNAVFNDVAQDLLEGA
jgi:TetR/AcrR family transcriptional regulator, transcriptional repressor for nem operon